jgi:hypothetical protein
MSPKAPTKKRAAQPVAAAEPNAPSRDALESTLVELRAEWASQRDAIGRAYRVEPEPRGRLVLRNRLAACEALGGDLEKVECGLRLRGVPLRRVERALAIIRGALDRLPEHTAGSLYLADRLAERRSVFNHFHRPARANELI